MPTLLNPSRFGGGGGSVTKFLSLPGSSGSYVSSPSDAAFQRSTHEMIWHGRKADWSPAANQILYAKWQDSTNRSYIRRWQTDGVTYFQWSTNGSTTTGATFTTAGLGTTLTNGSAYWLRDRWNGPSRQISTDYQTDQVGIPASWTAGISSATGGTLTLFPTSTADFTIGSEHSGTVLPFEGDIYNMYLYDAFGGTLVWSLDPGNWTTGSTWVTNTGHAMTLHGSATIGSE